MNFYLRFLIPIAMALAAMPICALAAGPEPELIVIPNDVRPSKEIYWNWMREFFESDEVWRVSDQDTYNKIVDSNIADPELAEQLKALYQEELKQNEFIKSYGYYNLTKNEGIGGYVIVPEPLRRKVPQKLLQAIYAHSSVNLGIDPPNSLNFTSRENLERFLDFNIPIVAWETMQENTIQLHGEYLLLTNKVNWNYFPENIRRETVENSIRHNAIRRGLNVYLFIKKGDDLGGIAEKYAAGRDPQPILNYLKKTLGDKQAMDIPLENIMPPFIRKMIDTYASCSGPDCYNSAVNMSLGNRTRKDTNYKELSDDFRYLRPEEKIELGDIIALVGADGEEKHYMNYVAEDIVFTKNGMSRFNPYIFQKMSTTSSLYFPDGKFQHVVYRHRKEGEPAAGKSERIYYWQHPEIKKTLATLQKIGFNLGGSKELNRLNLLKVLQQEQLEEETKNAISWIAKNQSSDYRNLLEAFAKKFQLPLNLVPLNCPQDFQKIL